MPSKKDRPFLVSLIALLWMFVGILVILMGLISAVAGLGFFGEEVDDYFQELVGSLGTLVLIVGVSIILAGLVIFALGYGLWNLNILAWLIMVILFGLATLGYVLNYEQLLQAIQVGLFSYLLTPIITIVLFIYFISVRSKFS
ncbi:MAG: hypothetical protein ACFE9L_12325 [Candidatus Hodarchaeota archaeon]